MIMKIEVDISAYSEKEIWDMLDAIQESKPSHLKTWLKEREEYL